MRYIACFVLQLTALLSPFANWQDQAGSINQSIAEWPSEFEGIPLTQLKMTEKERGFNQGFPGEIGRFTDGSREIIIRYIKHASRKVHPTADCLRGSGYQVQPQPISRDQNGHLWGCVLAQRDGISYKVCERIYTASGESWYDISSWFWSAILNSSSGPWWAITVAEKV